MFSRNYLSFFVMTVLAGFCAKPRWVNAGPPLPLPDDEVFSPTTLNPPAEAGAPRLLLRTVFSMEPETLESVAEPFDDEVEFSLFSFMPEEVKPPPLALKLDEEDNTEDVDIDSIFFCALPNSHRLTSLANLSELCDSE